MQLQLPNAFVREMKPLLGSEWTDFESAMHATATRGARIHKWNTPAHVIGQPDIPLSVQRQLQNAVSWTPYGYYIDEHSPLGRTIYHDAGAFYIQEPSAMAIALAVDPQPGERILDLCAAPGGKTTSIASLSGNRSRLIANEIHPARVKILAENVERMGAAAAVTNSAPEDLAKPFNEAFDAILVDAPCSGEGMFRKDPESTKEYNTDTPALCSARQRKILESAVTMLRPGGRLVYSTCTFNPLENEEIVAWLTQEYGMVIDELPMWPQWSRGRPEWVKNEKKVEELVHTRRLWPHRAPGEGHFVARLIKPQRIQGPGPSAKSRPSGLGTVVQDWPEWLDDQLHNPIERWKLPILHKDILFSDELGTLSTKGVRLLRPGTPLATVEKRRFVPLHGMSLRLQPADALRRVELDEQTAIHYMMGDVIPNEQALQGYAVVAHAGINLGWVKAVPGRLNNLYPKGWRRSHFTPLSEH